MRAISLITLLLFIIVSCEGTKQELNNFEESSLRIADHIPFSTLNPFHAMDGAAASLLEIIYSPLIIIDENGEVLPHLARSWEISNDLKKWRFKIRNDVRFHDGSELKAADVLYTFKLIMDHGISFHKGYARYIESMRLIDCRVSRYLRLAFPVSQDFYKSELI